MYDLAILGGGPAGIAAGVYASRKKLHTVLITVEIGGQSTVSENIQNWIGTVSMSGSDFSRILRAHLDAYKNNIVDVVEGVLATNVEKTGDFFTITDERGTRYEAKTVLVTTGAHRRKLTIPGAEEYDQKGLTYCASCDGPLFSDMDVAVIGGGNAGFETAAQLLAYAKSVTLLHRRSEFKADPITVEKVLSHEKMKALMNVEPVEVKGEKFATGLVYQDKTTGERHELPVSGIFVEIGLIPNSELVKGLVELDEVGRIKTDGKNQRTSAEGVWAAGDCTDELYHQNNIAAGEAITAIEDIFMYLRAR